jgi:hypothetical protein
MADLKISQLTGASTPLAGTEVLPIVQSGSTVKVSVANLTAGRSFDALGMTLTSTDAGATASPLLELYRDSASPAANDTIGEIEFNGEDSAGNKQQYALIHGSILSPTSTTEQGQIHFETATAGAVTEKMSRGTTNRVSNEIGAVFNVRIEGDTDANLFYTDATNSRVGVGTISPTAKLDVAGGDIRIDNGNLIIGTDGKGIDFSATPGTGTSELLDDYEEGTWTPSVTAFGGGSSVPTFTGFAASGAYTKIGRQVTITGRISWTTCVGGAGFISISSLPFTTATEDGFLGVMKYNSTYIGGTGVLSSIYAKQLMPRYFGNGESRVKFGYADTPSFVNDLSVTDLLNSAQYFEFSVTYFN